MRTDEQASWPNLFTVVVDLTRDHKPLTAGTSTKLVTNLSRAELEIFFNYFCALKLVLQVSAKLFDRIPTHLLP